MHKTDFSEFEVGMVFNGVEVTGAKELKHQKLTIGYPSRLEAMALDPSKVVDNNNLVYDAGQIDFCVALFKYISVEVDNGTSDITISGETSRKSLVMHAALLMKKALGFTHGLKIDVKDDVNLRHCGLGSSSALIAGTAAAINELYACPIAPLDLAKYCAQNHGEEIDGDDTKLIPVQCIGGSAVCGNFKGGVVILSGEATPIMSFDLPEELSVVIGVPSDFGHPDSKELMEKEDENMEGFKNTGQSYGPEIAYRLIHEVMPALVRKNLKPCKDLIFDYRWDMGSIKNCSFVLPRINEIAESLRPLKEDEDVAIMSLSSVGPGFFALTSNSQKIKKYFEEQDMNVIITRIHNDKYTVEY